MLLGVIIWVLALLLLRSYGVLRRRLWGGSKEQEEHELRWKGNTYRREEEVVGSWREEEGAVSWREREVVGTTTGPPSSRSSPKSESSGIGVSEKESLSEKEEEEEEEGKTTTKEEEVEVEERAIM